MGYRLSRARRAGAREPLFLPAIHLRANLPNDCVKCAPVPFCELIERALTKPLRRIRQEVIANAA